MTDDDEPLFGTVRETFERLRLAYPSQITGEEVNSKLMATDLIVVMKCAGKSKGEFLYNIAALWDDIEMERYQ